MVLTFAEWVLHQPGATPALYKELLNASGLEPIHDTTARMLSFITRSRTRALSVRQTKSDLRSLYADYISVTNRTNSCVDDLLLLLSGTEPLQVSEIYPHLSHQPGTVRKNLSMLSKNGLLNKDTHPGKPSHYSLTTAGQAYLRDYVVTGIRRTWSRKRKLNVTLNTNHEQH